MKVLVDTSVWSLSLRKRGPADHPAVHRLASYIEGHTEIVLTGVILQEILQAFRSPSAVEQMTAYFEAFPLLPLDRRHYEAAAALHRRCAAGGITASTTDCLIATAASAHGCRLLTTDQDFELIAQHTELSLEP